MKQADAYPRPQFPVDEYVYGLKYTGTGNVLEIELEDFKGSFRIRH